MSKKKVYRSLFDSDDVFEVEELTDNPEVSTEGIAEVKKDEDGTKTTHTIDECWNAIQEIKASLAGGKVKDANEPATPDKVEPQKVDIDKSKAVNATDGFDEDDPTKVGDESKEDEEDDTTKGVKDSYSAFTRVGEKKKVDPAVATQVAFQSRYDRIANK